VNETALQGLTLAGTFLSASIWWVRASLAQQNKITDRFISSLEMLLAEKREEARLNRIALARLTGAVRRNSSLITRFESTSKLMKESMMNPEKDSQRRRP